MSTRKAPRAPSGLNDAGKHLWRKLVIAELDYSPPELRLIEEACRIADSLALLRTLRPSEKGLRLILQHQMELRRALSQIDWPSDDDDVLRGAAVVPQGKGSDWGRKMAVKRWKRSEPHADEA